MVSLPGLDSYSADELQTARERSRAFAHYERLLQRSDIDPLHAERHRAWLECVLATYFERASAKDICSYWSDAADRLLIRAWNEEGLAEAVLFALGKHGAQELNLSSDIDVLVVAEPAKALETEKRLRRFQQRLTIPGEFGFCFRLDFDLRPGGKMGPRITTPAQFQDYYWSQGETWERLALVRLRYIAGSAPLAKSIEDLARRYSYRRFLDFTLLEDLKSLRTQVHEKGFQRRDDELHLKLEVGGIRDIELFVHSLMVLNGGKLPELQTRSTDEALRRLAARGLMKAEESERLRDIYWHYRQLENTVQSFEDRQTHSLTDSALRAPTEMLMQEVDGIVSSLLGRVNLEQVRLPASEDEQKRWLASLGFSKEVIASTWDQLIKATALSHKNTRDERARREFLHAFVTAVSRHTTLDRDMGLRLLVDFVRATRAKATFFSMLLRSPRLLEDLARLFCQSSYLGGILASRPELLDHFILRVDEAWAADMEPLLQQMSERKLLTEIWAANQFLNDGNLDGLFARITETADEICRQLLSQLRHEFPDSLVKIVALGKWGGEELGLRSDLDFIFVTPSAPRESDFKVARRFISRLTDPLRGGNLYEVDLRLRPSGQSGPLLVAEESLRKYWEESAVAWERQAYLRSRPLGLELDTSVLSARGLNAEELAELQRIRGKLLTRPSADEIDVKHAPGGLIDIEFSAQTAILERRLPRPPTATLAMIARLPGWERLGEIYRELRRYGQLMQLASTYKVGSVKREQVDKVYGWEKLTALTREASALLDDLDPTGLKRSILVQ